MLLKVGLKKRLRITEQNENSNFCEWVQYLQDCGRLDLDVVSDNLSENGTHQNFLRLLIKTAI